MSKISLEILDAETDNVLVTFNGPGRVEVALIPEPRTGKERVMVYVYDSTEVDLEQIPALVYDGTDPPTEDVREV